MDKLVLLIFAMFILLHASFSEGRRCIFTKKVTVRVSNFLPPNSAPLVLHCASGDNDLGNHTLSVNQNFEWSFCTNFIWTGSLFFCHLWWGPKNVAFESFNQEDYVRCTVNVFWWSAKSDGIYFTCDGSPLNSTKKYDWTK
ncbi:hypothetical protein ABFS83_06G159200 [Erythranthe nasuta]